MKLETKNHERKHEIRAGIDRRGKAPQYTPEGIMDGRSDGKLVGTIDGKSEGDDDGALVNGVVTMHSFTFGDACIMTDGIVPMSFIVAKQVGREF